MVDKGPWKWRTREKRDGQNIDLIRNSKNWGGKKKRNSAERSQQFLFKATVLHPKTQTGPKGAPQPIPPSYTSCRPGRAGPL